VRCFRMDSFFAPPRAPAVLVAKERSPGKCPISNIQVPQPVTRITDSSGTFQNHGTCGPRALAGSLLRILAE
jgi:hypothetical protein